MDKIRILFAEDVLEDMMLAEKELHDASISYIGKRVDNRNDFVRELEVFEPDLVISDYSMPSFTGMEALQIVLKTKPHTPVIIYTGSLNEETAVKCMKAGAFDYVLKERTRRLPFAVSDAIEFTLVEKQKKEIQSALKRSEEKYRGLFNSISHGILYINEAGHISMQNPAAIKILNLDKRTYFNINELNYDWNFLNEQDLKVDIVNYISKKNLQSNHAPAQLVVKAHPKGGGELKWLHLTFIPQFTSLQSDLFECLIILEDITERKEAEYELITAKLKAEESDRLKSAFLANLSHEVRTPMNAILGFSELLSEINKDDDTEKYFINTIQTNSIKLLNIITDIIEMSKIETEKMVIQINKFELRDIGRLVNDLYKLQATSKNLQLHVNGFDDRILLETDEQKFKKIIFSLVDNAIKFTDKGQITVQCSLKDNFIELHITDTGIGIPEGKEKFIFERFRQSDESYSKRHGGTGLGLSISKAYVEALGGQIWCTTLAKGTDFCFRLPVAWSYKPDVPIRRSNLKPAPDYSKYTILVAEDDATNYVYISKLLNKTKATVLNATNGVETIEMFQSDSSIDLILMDMKMPIMDGFEAISRIREFDKDIPIIAVTAYAISGDKEKCLSAGANDYVSKPIKRGEFFDILNRYLP